MKPARARGHVLCEHWASGQVINRTRRLVTRTDWSGPCVSIKGQLEKVRGCATCGDINRIIAAGRGSVRSIVLCHWPAQSEA